jgi:hypothetical protein
MKKGFLRKSFTLLNSEVPEEILLSLQVMSEKMVAQRDCSNHPTAMREPLSAEWREGKAGLMELLRPC